MSLAQEVAEQRLQIVERHAAADGDVVNLIQRVETGHGRGEQVRLHDVGNGTEIARRLAVAVNHYRKAAQHAIDPARYHGRVSTLRILPPPAHAAGAQAD